MGSEINLNEITLNEVQMTANAQPQMQEIPENSTSGQFDMPVSDENELAEVDFEDEMGENQPAAGNSQNIKDYLLSQEKWLGNTSWGGSGEHETNGELEDIEVRNFMSKLQTGAEDTSARGLYNNWVNQNSSWNANFANEHSYEDFEAFYNENNPQAVMDAMPQNMPEPDETEGLQADANGEISFANPPEIPENEITEQTDV